MEDTRRNLFTQICEDLYGDAILVPAAMLVRIQMGHLDAHQHGGRKQAETYVTEFCYKSLNHLSMNSQAVK